MGLIYGAIAFCQAFPTIEALINQGHYQKARVSIEHLLDDSAKKTELWWLLGVVYVALDDDQKALAVFNNLLKESPDFFPEGEISPKIHAIFSRAQKVSHDKMPAIELTTNWHASNATFVLRLGEFFKPITKQGILYVRSPKEPYYLAHVMELSGNELRATITAENLDNALAYYITLVGRFGKPFYYLGQSSNPYHLAKPLQLSNKSDAAFLPEGTARHEGLLLLGSAIMVAITLVFGLLKIGPSI